MGRLGRSLVFGLSFLVLSCGGREIPVFSGPGFDTDPPRPGPLNGRIVATDNGDDTLAVCDPTQRRMMWQVPVGFIPVELEGPHHVSASPLGDFFYFNLSEAVTGSGSGPHGAHGTGTQPGFVLKMEAQTASLVKWAQVDPNPGDNTISPDGKTVYATHYDLIKWTRYYQMSPPDPSLISMFYSTLAVIDADTMNVQKKVPICFAAHGLRTSADGQVAYSTCGPDQIAVIRLSEPGLPVTRVPLTAQSTEGPSCDRCPYGLNVAPDGTVWVGDLGPNGGGSGGGDVRVYDPALGAFDPARVAPVNGRALFAAFTHAPSGWRVYVPEQGFQDFVRIYDPKARGQAPVEVGHIGPFARNDCLNAHMILISDDDKTGYLVCEGDHVGPGRLVLLDLSAGSMIVSIPIGVFPDGIALIPPRGSGGG